MSCSALVTGASRGIGLGFVKHLLNKPEYTQVFAGVRELTKETELRSIDDPRLSIVQLDVTSDESIDSAVRTVASKVQTKGLSVLINNAGVMSDKSTHEHPDRQALMNIFNVNVFGTVMNSAKFLTLLQAAGTLERPSKLINLSSIAGSIEHIPDQRLWMMNSSYAMTKAAINSYTTYFAFTEFTNIITAAIHPGWVQTRMGGKDAEITVDESVGAMLHTIGKLNRRHSGRFMDRFGHTIPY